LKIPIRLFGAFRPTEWNEEGYTRRPPFTVETISGLAFLVPRDSEVETTLERISSSLALKKARQKRARYLVTRDSALKALREFDWYVRRSWRNKELRALWALAYLGEKEDWSSESIHAQDIAEAAGLTSKECAEALQQLFHARKGNSANHGLAEFVSDRGLIQQTLERKVEELPFWTEETLMSALCSGPGASVSELYESVQPQGLSIGAVYKVAERLKTQGYVYTLRHYRVNSRGPMREMLSADCRNCFFGFANPERCLEDSLKQVEGVLEHEYDKRPSLAERASLYRSLRALPSASGTNRRALTTLRLMAEVERMTREAGVSNMLRKIEEFYGVTLPFKVPRESSA
jgi:hypothetical protein